PVFVSPPLSSRDGGRCMANPPEACIQELTDEVVTTPDEAETSPPLFMPLDVAHTCRPISSGHQG
ncbi:MAG TPA: hypothetical protein PKK41_06695, partial [Methanoculleus sp.]|nr:hypothetical protein [Methanoculleus sp.]